ncbi:type II secretion system F family protein [Streptomyces sp. LE64]|uniref:type II secretion system F family protein n=1 Tax=Streptomyces sp. LE64 TaxID=3448653 RepID=UPI00404165B5
MGTGRGERAVRWARMAEQLARAGRPVDPGRVLDAGGAAGRRGRPDRPASRSPGSGRSGGRPDPGRYRSWTVPAGAWCVGFLWVEGIAGVLVGAVAAVAAGWFDRSRSPGPVAPEPDAELPLAADLLAACVAAGADPVTAARAVGESLVGPPGGSTDGSVAAALVRGAAELRLGAAPGEAWSALAALPEAGGLARLLAQATESGAPAAAPVARYAAEVRAARGRQRAARARRAGVLITAPVGLCFLPAFLVIGVLPVVIGLAERMWGPGAG